MRSKQEEDEGGRCPAHTNATSRLHVGLSLVSDDNGHHLSTIHLYFILIHYWLCTL